MCTVVVQWAPARPVHVLALRDELTTREFDDPGAWWPGLPDVVAGRDRVAGGTWSATRVSTGVTALVLNRPHKRVADPGAPSRGVLPLLAVEHETDWTSYVDLTGMASFALVLATPRRLATWAYDGASLTVSEQPPGTHMVTSGGAEDGKAARYLDRFEDVGFPDGWRALVERQPPQDDPAALVVRRQLGDVVYATVFGSLLETEPGRLRMQHSRTPWEAGTWVPLAVDETAQPTRSSESDTSPTP